MAQHDFNLENQTFANFRLDANNALAALATLSSGGTAPSATFPNQLWTDTASGLIKQRNTANTAWNSLYSIGSRLVNRDDLPFVNVTWDTYGAVPDANLTTGAGTDNTAAFRAAIATGKRVVVPKGFYRITGELECVTPGQVIEFEGTGGFGAGLGGGASFIPNTLLVATGTFAKRVRTRRKFRGSSSDPQDDPLSVVFNLQAPGIQLIRPGIWLRCDYSNTSNTNLGDDCDVAIFNGCRYACQIHDPVIVGYFRRAHIYIDVTNGASMPRFNSLAGTPYTSTSPNNGADHNHIWNPVLRGGRAGIVILGALPKVGATDYGDPYYDEAQGTTVTDDRGSSGCSDFMVFGGFYYLRHHSNWRFSNPTPSGGTLNQTSLESEPDTMPAAFFVDGLASNSPNCIQNIRIWGMRGYSGEAFNFRFNRASGITIIGSHLEGQSGTKPNASGVNISAGDYTLNSYGHISGTSNTGTLFCQAISQNTVEDTTPHWYGGIRSLNMTRGRFFAGEYIQASSGNLSLRGASTSDAIEFRAGATTLGDLNGTRLSLRFPIIEAYSGNLSLRGAGTGDSVDIRAGSTTLADFTTGRFLLRTPLADNRTDVVISAGVISVTSGYMRVDTEGSAATDDVDTINGGVTGMEITITPLSTVRTVVIKHGTGNIRCDGRADFTLDSDLHMVKAKFTGSVWIASLFAVAGV